MLFTKWIWLFALLSLAVPANGRENGSSEVQTLRITLREGGPIVYDLGQEKGRYLLKYSSPFSRPSRRRLEVDRYELLLKEKVIPAVRSLPRDLKPGCKAVAAVEWTGVKAGVRKGVATFHKRSVCMDGQENGPLKDLLDTLYTVARRG